MAHLRKLATGHLAKRGDTGHLSKCGTCSECAFCDGGGSCVGDEPGCPDSSCCTPSRWQAVISGFTIPAGCWNCDTAPQRSVDLSVPDPDGTYTLAQTSGCIWRYQAPATASWDGWNNATCSGDPDESYAPTSLFVQLEKTGVDTYQATVGLGSTNHYMSELTSGLGPSDLCDQAIVISGTVPVDDCDTNLANWHLNSQGSVTFTPCV